MMSRSRNPHDDLHHLEEDPIMSDERARRIEDLRTAIRSGTYGEKSKLRHLLGKMLTTKLEEEHDDDDPGARSPESL